MEIHAPLVDEGILSVLIGLKQHRHRHSGQHGNAATSGCLAGILMDWRGIAISPPENAAVEALGLTRCGGEQIYAQGHAKFGGKCGHELQVPPLFRIKVIVGGGLIKVVIIDFIGGGHACRHTGNRDDVPWTQHLATAGVDLTVHADLALGNEFLGQTARFHQVCQLQELPETDGLIPDCDIDRLHVLKCVIPGENGRGWFGSGSALEAWETWEPPHLNFYFNKNLEPRRR